MVVKAAVPAEMFDDNSLKAALKIRSVETIVVDLPIRRPHVFTSTRITSQAYLLVFVTTEDGSVGYGEGATPGGPWWSGDSIETMQKMIEVYLGPAIIGESACQINSIHQKMNRVAAANEFAKGAIDIALWDLLGKALGVPVHTLFGGMLRERIELSWALGTNNHETDIIEAEDMLARRVSRVFKIKAGALPPELETKRAVAIAEALGGRAEIRIDLSQAWDEATARKLLPVMIDAGLTLFEQPLQSWNIEGLARLRQMFPVKIMADESLTDLQSAVRLTSTAAADVFSLKAMKSGGLTNCRKICAVAESAGVAGYGGTFLESSIGAAAGLHLIAAEPSCTFGTELIGGIWLADEIAVNPLVYEDFHVKVPTGPGIGITLDQDKLARYRRK